MKFDFRGFSKLLSEIVKKRACHLALRRVPSAESETVVASGVMLR